MPLIKITPPPYVPRSDEYRVPCTDEPEHFFPPDRQEQPAETTARVAAAQAICFRCAIRTTCAAWARDHREWGIWGGRTEAEQNYRPTTRRLATHTKAAA
ncbi:WhiB family transcriptional regulator [Streptomyces sp. SCA3-4]|uniref:WhiB family transcriptional regulator n=1 Tax=Streptomyces sichuanensis TaxID=2871810 RepID=UPI001CE28CE5|nr:WhiB family transcriptional regulator [Streptomyces sichuanensis]MCA6090963.1 WhiB family transcriptional regulator [Streptomyces sichuanensis]